MLTPKKRIPFQEREDGMLTTSVLCKLFTNILLTYIVCDDLPNLATLHPMKNQEPKLQKVCMLLAF